MTSENNKSMPSITQHASLTASPLVHSNTNEFTNIKDVNTKITVDLQYDDAFYMNIHYVKLYLIDCGILPVNIDFDLSFLLHKHINVKKFNPYKPMP